ncbi:hypothetical protein V6N13_132293 [Hibiscus sabdariffa]
MIPDSIDPPQISQNANAMAFCSYYYQMVCLWLSGLYWLELPAESLEYSRDFGGRDCPMIEPREVSTEDLQKSFATPLVVQSTYPK